MTLEGASPYTQEQPGALSWSLHRAGCPCVPFQVPSIFYRLVKILQQYKGVYFHTPCSSLSPLCHHLSIPLPHLQSLLSSLKSLVSGLVPHTWALRQRKLRRERSNGQHVYRSRDWPDRGCSSQYPLVLWAKDRAQMNTNKKYYVFPSLSFWYELYCFHALQILEVGMALGPQELRVAGKRSLVDKN